MTTKRKSEPISCPNALCNFSPGPAASKKIFTSDILSSCQTHVSILIYQNLEIAFDVQPAAILQRVFLIALGKVEGRPLSTSPRILSDPVGITAAKKVVKKVQHVFLLLSSGKIGAKRVFLAPLCFRKSLLRFARPGSRLWTNIVAINFGAIYGTSKASL